MRSVIACALVIGCGGRARPASNRASPTVSEACVDHHYAMTGWMSFVVSDDPHNDSIPYDAVDSTWRSAEPSFAACFRGHVTAPGDKPFRIGVGFKISEAGIVDAVETWGIDAAIDRCVCETIKRIAFPHIHPRAFAKLAVGPG